MVNSEQINIVLTEIAGPLDALSVAFAEDEGFWIVVFEEELPVFLVPTGRGNHWILSGPIGDPPETAPEKFNDLVMIYNGQPELSGGFRIGLDEPEGLLKLSVDLSPADLEPDALLAMIGELRKCRRTWGDVADNWQPRAADTPPGEALIPPDSVA